jgi:hypothetical protein
MKMLPREKYAVIVIPDVLVDRDLPSDGKLADDLWFSRQPPFHFSRTWVEWIGNVRANALKKASLSLVSKGPSIKPDVLDDENEHHKRRAGSLYWSLILSDFFSCYNPPFSIMGAVRDEDLENVRSVGQFPQPHAISWIIQKPIDLQRLERAAEYSTTIPDFQGSNRFDRFGRIMRAFYDGIISHHPPDSLHQFVRCVDGFVYSDIGRSKRQFKSRTELFLGHGFHDLTEELYEIMGFWVRLAISQFTWVKGLQC